MCVIYGEGSKSKKVRILSMLETDMGLRYVNVNNDIHGGACVSSTRDGGQHWSLGYNQCLSDFVSSRRKGNLHPPLPSSMTDAASAGVSTSSIAASTEGAGEQSNMRYPVGKTGWVRTLHAACKKFKKNIYDQHVRAHATVNDSDLSRREDGLSVGIDTDVMDQIKADKPSKKALKKAEKEGAPGEVPEAKIVMCPDGFDATALKAEIDSLSVGADTKASMESYACFRFGRGAVLFLFDSINSAFKGSGVTAKPADDDKWEQALKSYRRLFGLGAATFQKRIYLYSPEGKFWHIQEADRFDDRRKALATLATQSGWLALDAQPLLETLDAFRHTDKWHFATNRNQDWGLMAQFQKILTLVMAMGRFVAMDDPLVRALASCPLRGLTLPNPVGEIALVQCCAVHHTDQAYVCGGALSSLPIHRGEHS